MCFLLSRYTNSEENLFIGVDQDTLRLDPKLFFREIIKSYAQMLWSLMQVGLHSGHVQLRVNGKLLRIILT